MTEHEQSPRKKKLEQAAHLISRGRNIVGEQIAKRREQLSGLIQPERYNKSLKSIFEQFSSQTTEYPGIPLTIDMTDHHKKNDRVQTCTIVKKSVMKNGESQDHLLVELQDGEDSVVLDYNSVDNTIQTEHGEMTAALKLLLVRLEQQFATIDVTETAEFKNIKGLEEMGQLILEGMKTHLATTSPDMKSVFFTLRDRLEEEIPLAGYYGYINPQNAGAISELLDQNTQLTFDQLPAETFKKPGVFNIFVSKNDKGIKIDISFGKPDKFGFHQDIQVKVNFSEEWKILDVKVKRKLEDASLETHTEESLNSLEGSQVLETAHQVFEMFKDPDHPHSPYLSEQTGYSTVDETGKSIQLTSASVDIIDAEIKRLHSVQTFARDEALRFARMLSIIKGKIQAKIASGEISKVTEEGEISEHVTTTKSTITLDKPVELEDLLASMEENDNTQQGKNS